MLPEYGLGKKGIYADDAGDCCGVYTLGDYAGFLGIPLCIQCIYVSALYPAGFSLLASRRGKIKISRRSHWIPPGFTIKIHDKMKKGIAKQEKS